MRTILILCGLLAGCASAPSPTANLQNPINRVNVNCGFAAKMSQDLARIIENPNADYPEWRQSFASLSGYSTVQQRVSSAKTILWSIRTNCPGF